MTYVDWTKRRFVLVSKAKVSDRAESFSVVCIAALCVLCVYAMLVTC